MNYKLSPQDCVVRAEMQCSICTRKTSLLIIQREYSENWIWRAIGDTSALACGYCAHQIFNEHDEVPELKDSVVCRCGKVINKNQNV